MYSAEYFGNLGERLRKDSRNVKKLGKRVEEIAKMMRNPEKTWMKANSMEYVGVLEYIESQLAEIRTRFESFNKDKLCEVDSVLTEVTQLKQILSPTQLEKMLYNLRIGDSSLHASVSALVLEVEEEEDNLEEPMKYIQGVINQMKPRETEDKFLDMKHVCEDLGLHCLNSEGGSYEFVGFATQNVPTFSDDYGYGLHLNFFARQSGDSSPELIFLELAFGDPEKVVRCVSVGHQPIHIVINVSFSIPRVNIVAIASMPRMGLFPLTSVFLLLMPSLDE